MKHTLIIYILLITFNAWSQPSSILSKPTVDQRIELISIAFRLADAWEYSSNEFTDYVGQIQMHYGEFKNHELIEYIKMIRDERSIGYDAVMAYAINITQPPDMKPLIPFSETVPDKRWGLKTSQRFLGLLNAFYRDTNSELFFNQHTRMYRMASERFENVHKDLNIDWYTDFYGELPKGEFKTVIAAGIGDKGYGPQMVMPDGKEVIYAVIGVSQLDAQGFPEFNKEYFFPTVLHEFNHPFVNHLIHQYENDLISSGQRIYSVLGSQMNEQGYANWQAMFAEALVRAAVIKYMADNDFDEVAIQAETTEQLENGFVWTAALVQELARFDRNRVIYPRLEDFMPEVVTFFNSEALRLIDPVLYDTKQDSLQK